MTTPTLTDRYLHEVVRRIPANQRDDVADELRATITDTVEARDAEGTESAERDVLIEMGDPTRLAARYADRPLALIGAELYPQYVRLLKVLLLTVLPIVTAVSVAVSLFEDDSIGAAIGDGIGTVLNVGGQMIAWLTVIFALIERATYRDGSARPSTGVEWSPDDLPEDRQPTEWSTSACAAAVWNVLLIGLIVWQRTAEPYRADGDRLQVLNPDLWSSWIWPILAGLAGVAALELIRIAAGGWNFALATLFAVAEAVVSVSLAVVLFRHEFFNPEFLAKVVDGGWQVPDAVYTIAALSVLVISAIEVGQRFREAVRAERT